MTYEEIVQRLEDIQNQIETSESAEDVLSEIDILLKLLEESLNHPQEGNIIWD